MHYITTPRASARILTAAVLGLAALITVPVVAEKAPAPIVQKALAGVAQANSNDGYGLCVEAFYGENSSTGQAIPNFESPQRGPVHDQHLWIKRARGNQSGFPTNVQALEVKPVNDLSGYVYCRETSHWDKAVLGNGEDYVVSAVWVAYNVASSTSFKPTAYGTNASTTYWVADVNGASSSFSVPMPFGGGSNWSSNPPA